MTEMRKTKRGTPCSPRWDKYWIELVEHCEHQLDRPICGAGTAGGAPCESAPDAANGRCRFHGGIPHMGGRPGNVNALRDGLHARRLRPCTDRCPHWSTCPMAGAEVNKIPLNARPACVYERSEYESTLRGILESMGINPDYPNHDLNAPKNLQFARAMAVEAAEAYALTKVLAHRAAGVLKDKPMDDLLKDTAMDRQGTRTPISGAAEACVKFQREQRHWHRRVIECGEAVVELEQKQANTNEHAPPKPTDENKSSPCKSVPVPVSPCPAPEKPAPKSPAKTKWIQKPNAPAKPKANDKLTRTDFIVSLNAAPQQDPKPPENIIEAHARANQQSPKDS